MSLSKILVIESEAVLRIHLRDLLEFQGFEVIEAATGTEGLGLSASEQPNLVLCGTPLPDMEGLEVLTRLRQNPVTAHIRFIVLSMYSFPPVCRRLLQLDANDLLSKPVDEPDLLVAIAQQLAHQNRHLHIVSGLSESS